MQGVIEGVPIILVLIAGIGAPLAGWYATRRYRNPGSLARPRRIDGADRAGIAGPVAARSLSRMRRTGSWLGGVLRPMR